MASTDSKFLGRALADSFLERFNAPGGDYYTLFAGGSDETHISGISYGTDTSESERSVKNYTSFYRTIKKSEVEYVIPRSDWIKGRSYFHWRSSGQPSGEESCYVYNASNGMVYVCSSDNEYNRKDLRGRVSSSIAPTHTSGYSRLADGYEWLALYKIDWELETFLTKKWMPVPGDPREEGNTEIPIEDRSSSSTLESNSYHFCGSGYTDSGQCCIFHKDPFTDTISGLTFAAGELYFSSLMDGCYQCVELGERLRMNYSFMAGATAQNQCSSSIPVLDRGDLIKNSLYLSGSSTAKIQENIIRELDDGELISATIDLGGLTNSQKIVNSANPLVTITTSTGTGAEVKLLTIPHGTDKHIVTGITVNKRGSGFKDYTISALNNSDGSFNIASRIQLNFEFLDSQVDPRRLLDANCIMFNISESTDNIKNITNQDEFKFWGISKNATQEDSTGNVVKIGENTAPETATFVRATHKFQLAQPGAMSFAAYAAAHTPKSSGGKNKIQESASAGIKQGEYTISSSVVKTFPIAGRRHETEIYQFSTDKDTIRNLVTVVNQDDTSTSYTVSNKDISPVVDTGKPIHIGTNINYSMPPEGEFDILRFRIVKCL